MIKRNWVPPDTDVDKKAALAAAVKAENLTAVVYWLFKGVDPDVPMSPEDAPARTGLHLAVHRDNFLLAFVLTSAGADIHKTNADGLTPLALAAEKDSGPITQLILHFGADANVKCHYNGTDGSSPLHVAAYHGALAAATALVSSRRVNVNAQDDGGWTPLSWATEHGQTPVALFLLTRAAKPLIADMEGNVCLHWASYSGSLLIATRLMEISGPPVLRLVNCFGDTPLHIAARQGHWALVSLLLTKRPDVSLVNKAKETPLSLVLKNGPVETQMAVRAAATREANSRSWENERVLSTDATRGRERMAVSLVNGVDWDRLPEDFTYVGGLVETEEVQVERRLSGMQRCDCEDDCSSGNCGCVAMTRLEMAGAGLGGPLEGSVYGADMLLLPDVDVTLADSVVECNEACGCDARQCANRVAQRGPTHRLQIYKTTNRGWAVRALEPIRKGAFLFEYAGELLTAEAADAREDDSYLFELEIDGASHAIDARYYGNVSRFVNHSCRPNLFPVRVLWDHQDHRFSHIAFFARSNINTGEELSFDYGDKFWIVKHKFFRCKCDAAECKYSDERIEEFLRDYEERPDTPSSQPAAVTADDILANGFSD